MKGVSKGHPFLFFGLIFVLLHIYPTFKTMKNFRAAFLLTLIIWPSVLICQPQQELNKTDQSGRKQGHWIKRYPDNIILYDAWFRDNLPEGEFKRYSPYGTLSSVLLYSKNGTEADASIYHSNGFLAARGKYINRKKEGLWQFFSEFTEGYKVSEETYSANMRNGKSLKFYPEGNVAEAKTFVNDTAQGEWVKYHTSGKTSLKTYLKNGRINGSFEAWFENGNLQFSGNYKDDKRDGSWLIYDRDGKLKYRIEYKMGITNDKQMDIDSSDYLDKLEAKKGTMPDPEKTGEIW
jgi:antitoxin component YwqK of YwqJK toxin-antitoxin module